MRRAEQDYTDFVTDAWSRLFRTAYALTGSRDAAEELLQATLVKVYVHWRKVNRAESPNAYVRRVMVNQASSHWRTVHRRREVLTAEHRDRPGPAPHEPDDELWQLILGLPDRQRAVLVLRYYEDLSEQEIAEVLGVAPGTVKSQCSAALQKLRRTIQTAPAERGES